MMITLSSATTWSFLKKGTQYPLLLFPRFLFFFPTAAEFLDLLKQPGGTTLFVLGPGGFIGGPISLSYLQYAD
jgi:hypothetical protein